jgi:hypothetical protein
MVSVPSSAITSNLCSARTRFASSRAGGTASKSRNGWYRSMVRPRSAQRARTSFGDQGATTRSFSNSSMPSNPAAAAAAILLSRVPETHTVAIALRNAVSVMISP